MKMSAASAGVGDFAATTLSTSVRATVGRFLGGLRHYVEERRMRSDLADLDPMILKDMGVGEDEIDRVRVCDEFTPRAWKS